MPTDCESGRRCRAFESSVDTLLRIADGWESLPSEAEPEPGWFATMAESCRAVADVVRRFAALTPPPTVAELDAWLRTHHELNDDKENDEHVSGDRGGRHRLR